MYAIINASGHQYRVEKDQVLRIDRQALGVGDKFETSNVLLVQTDNGPKVGAPFVAGAKVVATVIDHGQAKKIRVFKYKSKKNYRRTIGHRAQYTTVRVDEIVT